MLFVAILELPDFERIPLPLLDVGADLPLEVLPVLPLPFLWKTRASFATDLLQAPLQGVLLHALSLITLFQAISFLGFNKQLRFEGIQLIGQLPVLELPGLGLSLFNYVLPAPGPQF